MEPGDKGVSAQAPCRGDGDSGEAVRAGAGTRGTLCTFRSGLLGTRAALSSQGCYAEHGGTSPPC